MLIEPPHTTASSVDAPRKVWTDRAPASSLHGAMTLHVDDPGFLALERELAHDETRLHPLDGRPGYPPGEERLQAILRIARRAATRPVLDERTPDEILGYDESGLPT